MFIPQVLFCLGACYIGSADPRPTEAACREHTNLVMVPTMRQVEPGIRIMAARCRPLNTDTAA